MADDNSDNIPCIATSAPDYIEEVVIDLDVSFTQGSPVSVTIRPEKGDVMDTFPTHLSIRLHRPGLIKPEEVTIFLHSVTLISERHRIKKTPKPGPPKAEHIESTE